MKARLAVLLLQASGLAGGAGPVLAAACARVADALAWAAERVSPVEECPGCGAAVPALTLAGVEVCGECQHAEEDGPTFPTFGPPDDASEADADAFWLALLTNHDAPRVNVYHHRSSKTEEPS